jgi:RNA polymerase sigma-70 factor (ECF subfamily)
MAIDVAAHYQTYGPMVLRRCRFLLKQEERALDAMQEVFVRLLTYQNRLRGDYPSSLLYRMATNVCLNLIRSSKHTAVNDSEEIIASIASAAEHDKPIFLNAWLDHLFRQEKPTTKEMMVMLYVDGMTLEEVAEAFGMSVSGVRKRVREFKTRVQALKEYEHV